MTADFSLFFNSYVPGIRFDGEPSAEPSATPPANDMQAQIDAAVEKALAPVVANKDMILTEKRTLKAEHDKLKATIESLGGDDGIKALVAARTELQKTELGKLLADGKHEEWYDKRTESLRADHANQITALEDKATKSEEKAVAAIQRLSKLFLQNEISVAATALKTIQEEGVLDDICRLAAESFSYDEKHDRCVIKDEGGGILPGKDGVAPKTVKEWLEEQKKARRHWWPASRSGDLDGNDRSGPFDGDGEFTGGTQAEYEAWRKKRGFRNQYQP